MCRCICIHLYVCICKCISYTHMIFLIGRKSLPLEAKRTHAFFYSHPEQPMQNASTPLPLPTLLLYILARSLPEYGGLHPCPSVSLGFSLGADTVSHVAPSSGAWAVEACQERPRSQHRCAIVQKWKFNDQKIPGDSKFQLLCCDLPPPPAKRMSFPNPLE